MWDQSRYALQFFADNQVPFQDMTNDNSRVSNGNWCLVERSKGSTIVVYLKSGGTADVDLTGLGSSTNPDETSVSVDWYDPRNGGNLQKGSVTALQFGYTQSLGDAPSDGEKDWVVLLRCTSGC